MSVVVGNNLSVGRSGEVDRDRDDLSPLSHFQENLYLTLSNVLIGGIPFQGA